MGQPRLCPTSVAVVLNCYKLFNILRDPLLKLRLELAYFLSFPNIFWQSVPLFSAPVTEAVLGQGQRGVGDDDLVLPVVS